MTTYPKRLIEVDLPIKRISAHARREKSIRHGHISTLHIWWARRPLAACRAVICAALWPDPADPHCPQAFRDAASQRIAEFAEKVFRTASLHDTVSPESFGQWEGIVKAREQGLVFDTHDAIHLNKLRFALLDFIADFANWDNSTVPAYLETSRALTQAAHEALGGEPGTRPLVVDPFAGGGSIPLEALRVGADAFASDLNPVAVLLNKVVLEYIPKYGQRLADEVQKWGEWIKREGEKGLTEFHPADTDGATPLAYLWARTIISEAPGQGDIPIEVPLLRSMWLAKKAGRTRALRWVRDSQGQVITKVTDVILGNHEKRRVLRPLLEVFHPHSSGEVEAGTSARGSVTCPVTGYTTPVESVRTQLKRRKGGASDARMFCVVTTLPGQPGRHYRDPIESDYSAVQRARKALNDKIDTHRGLLSLVPDEVFSGAEPRRIPLPIYGITNFGDMFSPRQILGLTFLLDCIKSVESKLLDLEVGLRLAVLTCLAFILNRCADKMASVVVWHIPGEKVEHVFGRQAMPMVWDFAEANPLSAIGWGGATDWVYKAIISNIGTIMHSATVQIASATSHLLPDSTADAIVTDPPYYFSVPYADLSDFFYVWLKRSIGERYPEMFNTVLTPKADECIQNLPHSGAASIQKDRGFYERGMHLALAEARRISRPEAIGTVVFAHSETEAWESLLAAMISAGWYVTASWPIDTEMSTRLLAKRQSTLASSVHLVCRPRENPDGSLRDSEIGDWRDVLAALPGRIHEWMPRLADEGVVGADAIFACLGPALEIFSRYSRVEKSNGDVVPLREYLEHVWAAVSNEALSMIFKDADAAGLEPDARLTAMWLWTLGTATSDSNGKVSAEEDEADTDDEEVEKPSKVSGFVLEFDAARKIAQGLGIHLEKSPSIVEVKGDKARLLPVSERTKYLFGKEAADAPTAKKKPRKKDTQLSFFEELKEADAGPGGDGPDIKAVKGGSTVLDRVHQAMILFAAGRSEALKGFLVDESIGKDARFWKLAQSLSALYPPGIDEKRWVDGVLARKKGLGF